MSTTVLPIFSESVGSVEPLLVAPCGMRQQTIVVRPSSFPEADDLIGLLHGPSTREYPRYPIGRIFSRRGFLFLCATFQLQVRDHADRHGLLISFGLAAPLGTSYPLPGLSEICRFWASLLSDSDNEYRYDKLVTELSKDPVDERLVRELSGYVRLVTRVATLAGSIPGMASARSWRIGERIWRSSTRQKFLCSASADIFACLSQAATIAGRSPRRDLVDLVVVNSVPLFNDSGQADPILLYL